MAGSPIPSGRKLLLLLMLAVAVIGGAWWYKRPPHDPEHVFLFATLAGCSRSHSPPAQPATVTVGGTVRQSGQQPWTANLTLMSAVRAAGGPGDFATDKVGLTRDGTATLYRMKLLTR